MSISLVLGIFISVLVYLYILWKRLKEDYFSNLIFPVGFYSLFGAALGLGISELYLVRILSFDPWFWLTLIFSFTGYFIATKRFKINFVEAFEAYLLGFLYFITITLAFLGLEMKSFTILGMALFSLSLILVFYFLEGKYKDFAWYASGKRGFSGLVVGGAYFLVRAVIALNYSNVLSFVGKGDAVLSGSVAFLIFLRLYNLSKSNG